jgi:Acetyltransferase (GNAT) family
VADPARPNFLVRRQTGYLRSGSDARASCPNRGRPTVLRGDSQRRVREGGESGLWRDGSSRTTATEIAELIRVGQIAVTTRDGRIVGSVRIHDVADDVCEFGLLVAAPDQPSSGVGRALLDFVEAEAHERRGLGGR